MSDEQKCGGGVVIGEVEPYEMRGGAISTSGYKACGGCEDCDGSSESICPTCGDPIDYCQGHGSIG